MRHRQAGGADGHHQPSEDNLGRRVPQHLPDAPIERLLAGDQQVYGEQQRRSAPAGQPEGQATKALELQLAGQPVKQRGP